MIVLARQSDATVAVAVVGVGVVEEYALPPPHVIFIFESDDDDTDSEISPPRSEDDAIADGMERGIPPRLTFSSRAIVRYARFASALRTIVASALRRVL